MVIILGLFALLQVAIIFSIPRERHSEDFDNALGCPACPAPHAERAEEQNSNDSPNKSERRRVVEGSVVEALGETTPFVSAFELAARDSDASGAELKGDAARPRLFVADLYVFMCLCVCVCVCVCVCALCVWCVLMYVFAFFLQRPSLWPI